MDNFWQEFADNLSGHMIQRKDQDGQVDKNEAAARIMEALDAEENENQDVLLGQIMLRGGQWDDEDVQMEVTKMAGDYWEERGNPRMKHASQHMNGFIKQAMARIQEEREAAQATLLSDTSESSHPAKSNEISSVTEPNIGAQSNAINDAREKGHILSDPIKAAPGAFLDVDVQNLIEQLHQVVISDAPSQTDSPYQDLPRGLEVQMTYTSERYQQELEYCKNLEEKRKALGYAPATSKRRRLKHGFDPMQVVRKQAISLPKELDTDECRSTITTKILPLYKPENFHGCPENIYDVIAPALRLSSLLLTHAAASIYWLTLLFGKRDRCKLSSARLGHRTDRILLDRDIDPNLVTKFRGRLDNLANLITFRFDTKSFGTTRPDNVFGYMWPVEDYARGYHTNTASQPCRRSYISLHPDFYTVAKRLSFLRKNADPAMVLRFTFFLGLVLTHEVAHFLEVGHSVMRIDGGPVFREAFMNNNAFAEAGEAWELKLFGGRVTPINNRIDCAYGISIVDWPLRQEAHHEPNIYYTIPMRWIWWIQQQNTWDQLTWDANGVIVTDGCPGIKDFFHIPRSGARSVGLSALNLLIWDDEADVHGLENNKSSDVSAGNKGLEPSGRLQPTERPASGRIYGSAAETLHEMAREKERHKRQKKKVKAYDRKLIARDFITEEVQNDLMEAERTSPI